MQSEWWEEKVARRISVGVEKAADFRAPAPKERVVVCLGEERQKCMLAQEERCACNLRQGEANSQSRADFELVF